MQGTATLSAISYTAVPTAIIIIDHKGSILEWNPAATRLLGFKKTEVLHTKLHLLLDDTKNDKTLLTPQGPGKAWQMEQVYHHKNGKRVTCLLHANLNIDEKQIIFSLQDLSKHKESEQQLQQAYDALLLKSKEQSSMLHVANSLLEHNISERDKIDKVLRKNEERFRLLAENSTDIISQQTPDFKYLYVSPSCKHLLGYDPKEMVGQFIFHFIHEGDLKTIKDTNTLEIHNRDQFTLTYRVRRKDGNYVWFETTTKLIKEKGIITEIHATSRDITARILEERARLRTQKLAQVFRLSTMEEMASGMAHEINQPLAAVVNYTQGCIRHLESDASDKNKKLIEIMEKASDQAKRAGEIIHRLKNFFAKGKLYLSPEKCSRLIRESVILIKDDINKAHVAVKYQFEKNLPPVSIDKIQIQQVILNLIQNAIEAMYETPIDDRHLIIKTEMTNDNQIAFLFLDTGPGFPADVIQKIFQPFFTTKPRGTGMGLPISRSIVEAHGGKFALLSPQGKSPSGVRFTLPITSKKRR